MRLPLKHLLAALILCLLYFYGLTRVGIIGPDEPRYAAIGREMARSGDWITPRLWGQPWFEKPALLYWLAGLGFKAGLGPESAPRTPVVLLSLAFLVFYFLRVRREFGERAAWFAAAILATSAGWLAYSQVAVTDIPLSAAFSAAVLLAMPWVRSGGRRGLAFSGALLGIAVLAKGLVPLVLAAPLAWAGRRRPADLLILAAACLAVAAPWYLLCWHYNGDAFLDEFFLKHHLSRFTSGDLKHVQPWWFYVPVLLGFLFPWTPLLATLRLNWRDTRAQLLLLTVLFGFAFFSASTNKLPGYILPLLPSLACLIGIQMAVAPPSRLLLAGSAALLCLTPVVSATLPGAVADGLTRAGIRGYGSPALLLLAAGAIAVARLRTPRMFPATVALAVAAMLYLKWDAYPRLDGAASARPLWLQAQPACVDKVDRAIRYGLNYYAGRELAECSATRAYMLFSIEIGDFNR